MKIVSSLLLLVAGFFAGMFAEKFMHPRTAVVETPTTPTVDPKLEKIKTALLGFDFAGMINERQEMTVSKPLDICIQAQNPQGEYVLGVGVDTRVIGDRPPDMPETQHNYWLFKVIATDTSTSIVETIPTFSYDCKWISFEELQKKSDPIVE